MLHLLNLNQKRVCRLILFFTILILIGIVYATFIKYVGKGIPCVFYTITGYKCPGCGISRMFLCLFKGDLKGAWNSNPIILICLVPFTAVAADISYQYITKGIRTPHKQINLLLYILIVVLLVFGVARNIDF